MSFIDEITMDDAPMYTWNDARRIFDAKTLMQFIKSGEITGFRMTADGSRGYRSYRFRASEIRSLAKEYGVEDRL